MSRRQTDNSHLAEKIVLREINLPGIDPIRVLDCYAGKGVIWSRIAHRNPALNIRRLGIDVKGEDPGLLHGKAEKFLPSLNLDDFDVIDLDAYGVPYLALKEILPRSRGKIIFITFIQTVFGCLNKSFLCDLGYTPSMIKKCRSLFNSHGFVKLKSWLAGRGITEISYYEIGRKVYLCLKP